MQTHPRILFASPDEETLALVQKVLPCREHNILAISAYAKKYEDIIEYAKASDIELIISRGGIAEYLQHAQTESLSPIPIVNMQLSPFDLIEAIQEALKISNKIAFVAFANLLEYIPNIISLFNEVDLRFIKRSSPWDCYESIFDALENKAEVIIGDARTVALCKENNIPVIMLHSGEQSIRQSYQIAQYIIHSKNQITHENSLLKSLLNNINKSIFTVDEKGKVIYSNISMQKLFLEQTSTKNISNLHEYSFLHKALRKKILENTHGSATFKNASKKHSIEWKELDLPNTSSQKIVFIGEEKQFQGFFDKKEFQAKYEFKDILGRSQKILNQKERANAYAKIDATVLILGPSGTGKELFAHAIHNAGNKKDEPFIAINIATLPATLIESELFGYVQGAFTDARQEGKDGIFELAKNGTVFLDEIGELPILLQAKLLRVLQDGEFMKLGDDKPQTARCRIITATNRNLEKAMEMKEFREDLYYRLNILRLYIPPLKDRIEDLEELVAYYISLFSKQYNKNVLGIDNTALKFLQAREWKGNIRELKTIIERSVVLSSTPLLTKKFIQDCINDDPTETLQTPSKITLSKEKIAQVLQENAYKINESAAALGIHRSTLWRKLHKKSHRERN